MSLSVSARLKPSISVTSICNAPANCSASTSWSICGSYAIKDAFSIRATATGSPRQLSEDSFNRIRNAGLRAGQKRGELRLLLALYGDDARVRLVQDARAERGRLVSGFLLRRGGHSPGLGSGVSLDRHESRSRVVERFAGFFFGSQDVL